jgi:hypothetical protein
MKQFRLALLLLGVFFALAVRAAAGPALVVVIVIDGAPQEQLVKYRDLYGPGGFTRLLEGGAWFGDAHHGQAITTTAPGHAAILTGTYPYRHGIIDNEWIDRNSLAQVYCTGDTAHAYIGHDTKKLDGTSPANLRVSTVGDELKYSNNGQSKVITVSGKDRGAILLAGKRGTAYMYMDRSGSFASTTFYMKEHPRWHTQFYEGKPQERWLGQSWPLLLPEAAYTRSVAEGGQRAYAGMGSRFPFTLPQADKLPAYYAALMRSPFGDDATLEFVRAAIEGENLGSNPAGVADILGISLSTHDYVNHAFGPESRVSQDHLLRLDRALAGFFLYLDRRIGLDKVLIAVTSDHGFMNVPEYSAALGLGGSRFNHLKMMTDLNAHLAGRFGPGNHALPISRATLLLDPALIEKKSLNRIEVETEAARFLGSYPGLAAVFTRSQLETGAWPNQPLALQVQRAWNRDLSGDLYLVLNPNTMMGGNAATHGSPYNYDTNVPVMLYGKTWIKPGKYPQAVSVADIAPTLAYLLEIRPPSGSEGRVLAEIIR